ncbi:YibE/F family protein [Frankia sp. Cas4]|uniref:YibE/F family protein n=1 Tax=Frankia sp. Cas4 TaxID=3073927 RepID=UPI002AD4437E|nr:YibE/F family protein [Frankia sp. Cas4]
MPGAHSANRRGLGSAEAEADHGHGHGHGGGGGRPAAASRRSRIVLAVLLVPLFAATAVGVGALWPGTGHRPIPDVFRAPDGTPITLVNATIKRAERGPCGGGTVSEAASPPASPPASASASAGQQTTASATACLELTVLITSGPDAGRTRPLEQSVDPAGPTFSAGDKVRLGRSTSPGGGVDYYLSDFQRGRPLGILALVFALVVVAVARWRGLAALVGMALTYLMLVFFLLPALLDGRSPVAVSLVSAAAVLFVLLYLAHGPSARTSCALLGTLAGLGLTGVLGYLAIRLTTLTGLGSDESASLKAFDGRLSLTGLILAGLVIGSLGLLNDVTVTQASAVWELADASPHAPPPELYRSAMRIGRDHIASSIYTIMMAYAGAALPSLLLFTLADRSALDVVTGDLVAAEVVRTAVGAIGLVLSVPITTGIAALVAARRAL